MDRHPPGSTRTNALVPYTTLCRAADRARLVAAKSAGLAGQHGVDGHVHAVAPRGVHAAAPRGPNRMIAAPPRQKAAPIRSQRSGRAPSMAHSHSSAATIYTPP